MKNSEIKDFVAYEYISINVRSDKEPLYVDCYENFGFILVSNRVLIDKEDYYLNNLDNNKHLVNIKFKRNRKIKNKIPLLSLQKKLETSLKVIEKLEKEPFTKGLISSLAIGILGTIFLIIALFFLTTNNIFYILFLLVGIIGLILPYFIYKKVKFSIENKNLILIDKQYDIIYDSCNEARKLID